MYKPLRISLVLFVSSVLLAVIGCSRTELPADLAALNTEEKPASTYTSEINERVLDQLPFESRQDFDSATRGFIATLEGATVLDAAGNTVYSLADMEFLEGEAPTTVNPSLWRQAQLNGLLHGLFEVTEGIYQVRSLDLANMTLIAGDTGWIIVDPLLTSETAAAALALANRELGARPVKAVIITHSHVDHFGGMAGVVSLEEVNSGAVEIVAPAGLQFEAFSENLRAGNVMQRRARYQFGNLLPASPTGFVSTGLGNKTAAGTTGLIAPTRLVGAAGLDLSLDGVEFEFMDVPGAEAPAELIFYLPANRALCMAEISTHTLHNIYTLRGAKTRDADLWAQHINSAIDTWSERSEVMFASHHWPTWGQAELREQLQLQRDLYKFIHDQTLRLANQGLNMVEIAEQLELPEALGQRFANRGYYGTVNHGVKAVYNYYLGWFDGNPSNLHPLPPRPAALKYVEYMGGSGPMLERAAADYGRGEYRWVAELLRHLVFAQPENQAARLLLADSYEQLGYQAESGIWRNFYLSGARELRFGVTQQPDPLAGGGEGLLRNITVGDLVDAMAVRLDGEAAADIDLKLNVQLLDVDESWLLQVRNGVFYGFKDRVAAEPDVTLSLSALDLKLLLTGAVGAPGLLAQDRIDVSGNPLSLVRFATLFDKFDPNFNIVTP